MGPIFGGGRPVTVGGTITGGGTAGRVLFINSTGGTLTDIPGGDLVVSRYAAKQLMISGDGTGTASGMTGFVIGNSGTTQSAIWHSGVVPSSSNYVFGVSSATGNTLIWGPTDLEIYAGSGVSLKGSFSGTAGKGLSITAGTATTDVNALNITQTWNGGAVAFRGIRQVITNTASAAGSLDLSLERSTGQGFGIEQLTELTTIAAAATTDTTIQIPANVIVIGVSVRVTTVIPTAATFTVIGTTSSTAFQTGASVSTAATTTDVGTKSCPYLNATAQTIRFTPNAQPGDNSGRVRVTIHFIRITAPTS